VSGDAITLDRFLGGRLTIAQPRKGFRAGHDTVLLAAAVPAGLDLLELGAGAGVASLCVAARIPGVRVIGVEIDPDLLRLANENATRNGMNDRVRFELGDVAAMRQMRLFDHVFFNPPFHPVSGNPSPSTQRDRSMRDSADAVPAWTGVALSLTKPGGTVTAIVRADRASEALRVRAGDEAFVFPLFPRAGETPKRVIVQIAKGRSGPEREAAGLILHEPDGRNTEASEAVLRYGSALTLA